MNTSSNIKPKDYSRRIKALTPSERRFIEDLLMPQLPDTPAAWDYIRILINAFARENEARACRSEQVQAI